MFLISLSQRAIFSLVFLSSIAALALSPTDNLGRTFGVNPGIYQGEGLLHSGSLPDISFSSTRSVSQGVIHAETTATFFGFEIATASANLKIELQPDSKNKFYLIDIDTKKNAGDGACDESSCWFTATVMGGSLTLSERWVPNEVGFVVFDGAQKFKGLESIYELVFSPIEN